MKVEVHTIRYGTPNWLVSCAATLDDWVARHGYDLVIWTDKDQKPEYPCVKFCVVDMWRQFAESDSDWLVYLDGDIFIRHDAPAMDWLQSERDVLFMPKSSRKTNGRWGWWCRRYGAPDDVPRDWWMRNAGWMAIDKQAVQRLLPVVGPPYMEGTQDECQVNFWVLQSMEKHGLVVKSPPLEWHGFYWANRPRWMWHLARPHGKDEHILRLKAEGKI